MQPCIKIIVGARESPLSKSQVREVENEIKSFFNNLIFEPIFIKTKGDYDRESSLKEMEKADFFTKEIDELLLEEKCRIAIHSAKDLPDPLMKGLKCVALTKGVDPSDALLLRTGQTLLTLKPNSVIGTSSIRRETVVRSLRADLRCVEIRGLIHERLEKLYQGEVDGVVMATAALIRLNLLHLNWIKLPGETAPLQGKLAVIAKEEDKEMEDLFRTCSESF